MLWDATTDVMKCVRSRWHHADKNLGGGERWLKDKTVKQQDDEPCRGQKKGNLENFNVDYCNMNQYMSGNRSDWFSFIAPLSLQVQTAPPLPHSKFNPHPPHAKQ